MMTVRFPNGQAVQYSDANYLVHPSDQRPYAELWTKKGGRFIAQVPLACIVEFVAPCRVYNPIRDAQDQRTSDEISKLSRKVSKAINATKRTAK